jgi:hypothetical protein
MRSNRDTRVLLDRDELEADQLLLKTELTRHETKSGKEKNNMQSELNEPACNRTYMMLPIVDRTYMLSPFDRVVDIHVTEAITHSLISL